MLDLVTSNVSSLFFFLKALLLDFPITYALAILSFCLIVLMVEVIRMDPEKCPFKYIFLFMTITVGTILLLNGYKTQLSEEMSIFLIPSIVFGILALVSLGEKGLRVFLGFIYIVSLPVLWILLYFQDLPTT